MEIETIDIGSLNKRITFKRLTEYTTSLGVTSQKLESVAMVWGSFWPVRGAERYEAFRLESDAKFKCYVRYSQKLKDLSAEDFIEVDDTQYQITDILDVKGQHKLFEIYCTDKINREEKLDE